MATQGKTPDSLRCASRQPQTTSENKYTQNRSQSHIQPSPKPSSCSVTPLRTPPSPTAKLASSTIPLHP
ncbi:uncharacterized protein BDR25DRAFT_302669 [Lindgomyces ingoldianus]|uniref:Uncharacterized protein n=1 Tax=Lindgomyces ingoldianus TaxID=673940 RepID=A0ACB6QZN4_9PLEO|nr:uncharacterized protein BDR25DRAFT_302669 [Lindgomyces ingoldianus]KAF2472519.1 hypothetical protein BDR25DRAFT_302669 [Lindgomyces ingoldianus]